MYRFKQNRYERRNRMFYHRGLRRRRKMSFMDISPFRI